MDKKEASFYIDPAKLRNAQKALPESFTPLNKALSQAKSMDIYDFLSRDPSSGERTGHFDTTDDIETLITQAKQLHGAYSSLPNTVEKAQAASLVVSFLEDGHKEKYDTFVSLGIRMLLCKDIDSIMEFDDELSFAKLGKLESKFTRIYFPSQKVQAFILGYCNHKGYAVNNKPPEPSPLPHVAPSASAEIPMSSAASVSAPITREMARVAIPFDGNNPQTTSDTRPETSPPRTSPPETSEPPRPLLSPPGPRVVSPPFSQPTEGSSELGQWLQKESNKRMAKYIIIIIILVIVLYWLAAPLLPFGASGNGNEGNQGLFSRIADRATDSIQRNPTALRGFPADMNATDMSNLQRLSTISTGHSRTVAIKTDGTVLGVGSGDLGVLNISHWEDIISIVAGGRQTVGLRSDGTVVSEGSHWHGAEDVVYWHDIIAIASGAWHTVGLKSNGTVVAAGGYQWGQSEVSHWTQIVDIYARGHHTVGLRSDGTVVVVGTISADVVNIINWRDIVAISAGDNHIVGLRTDGTVVAEGNNSFGQLNVTNWANIIAISAGREHTVGLRSDGTVLVTGHHPVGMEEIARWQGIVAITAAAEHTIGLRYDGTVVAAGWNFWGQNNVSGWYNIRTPHENNVTSPSFSMPAVSAPMPFELPPATIPARDIDLAAMFEMTMSEAMDWYEGYLEHFESHMLLMGDGISFNLGENHSIVRIMLHNPMYTINNMRWDLTLNQVRDRFNNILADNFHEGYFGHYYTVVARDGRYILTFLIPDSQSAASSVFVSLYYDGIVISQWQPTWFYLPSWHRWPDEKDDYPPTSETYASHFYELRVLELTNEERARHNLTPLIWHEALANVAREHSIDMALSNEVSHTGSDGRLPGARLRDANISWYLIAENVAAGFFTPEEVVAGWMGSPGHRRNILDPELVYLGVGFYHLEGSRYTYHWTQKFMVALN